MFCFPISTFCLLRTQTCCRYQGRAEIAKLLVAAGADPHQKHSDGFNPLHRACWGRMPRHAETVQVFIDAGVPADLAVHTSDPESDGKTPLELTKNPETEKVLKKALGIATKN